MANAENPWCSWCRLCAKESSENMVEIPVEHVGLPQKGAKVNKTTVRGALEKYFWVYISPNEMLPKLLCPDCDSLVTSLAKFNERVKRVQQMFNYLAENHRKIWYDLPVIRKEYNICEENEIWSLFKNKTPSTVCTNEVDNSESDILMESFDSDEAFINTAEDPVLAKGECIQVDEGDTDSYDAMSDDSVWGRDNDKEKVDSIKKAKFPTTNARYCREDFTDQIEIPETIQSDKPNRTKTKDFHECDANCEKKLQDATDDFAFDISCVICKESFKLYSAYCEHMEAKHNTAQSKLSCPVCQRDLTTWYHLGKHMRTHMPAESRFPIKCPECDNRFSTNSQLEAHVDRMHRKEKLLICEVCGFFSASQASLSAHMLKHSDETPFKCEVCKKGFKRKYLLSLHMDTHNSHKYSCTICGKQLNSRATLRKHFVVHSEYKKYKCDYCGKGFKSNTNLKFHMILHTGLRPYSCEYCDRTFPHPSPYQSHMKKHHPEPYAEGKLMKPGNLPKLAHLKELAKNAKGFLKIREANTTRGFPCNFCDLKFTQRSARSTHMSKTHPEEAAAIRAAKLKNLKSKPKAVKPEPVTCEYCFRIFGYRKLYRSHLKRIHPEKLAAPEMSTEACFKIITKVEKKKLTETGNSKVSHEETSSTTNRPNVLDSEETVTFSSASSPPITSDQDLFMLLEY